MTRAYGSGARGKATELHAKLVRQLGYCQNCGGTHMLQCAHIIGRTYSATRTDLENAFCLCARCHARFTAHPDEWLDFVDSTIGRKEYERLKAKALKVTKVDWAAEAARLKALAAERGVQ